MDHPRLMMMQAMLAAPPIFVADFPASPVPSSRSGARILIAEAGAAITASPLLSQDLLRRERAGLINPGSRSCLLFGVSTTNATHF